MPSSEGPNGEVRSTAVRAAATSDRTTGGAARTVSGVGAGAAGGEVRLTEAGVPGGDVRARVAAVAIPGAPDDDAGVGDGFGEAAVTEAAASTAMAVVNSLRIGTSQFKLRGRFANSCPRTAFEYVVVQVAD
jgi:hypothetical protein